MRQPGIPDISSSSSLVRMALAIAVAVSAVLISIYWHMGGGLNDSDDAMRLVLVHDLLTGRGWYDQAITRVQPPLGLFMHWSRLLDGALAGAVRAMQVFLPPQKAEAMVLLLWPLAWVVPALVSALALARRLGGDAAILACMLLFLVDLQTYEQFRPGRIDHHNIQIVITLIAAACCLARGNRARWALVAGGAAGLGLAVGLEALLFQAIIALAYGLCWVFGSAKPARRYAGAFAVSLSLCFVLQTPSGRWSLSFCDTLGLNLVACGVIAGLGLFVATFAGERLGAWGRFAILFLIGAIAFGAWFALDPRCVHGPFGDIDPRIHPLWLDQVREIQSWPQLWRAMPDAAVYTIVAGVLVAVAALLCLSRNLRRSSAETLLACALALTAVILAASAYRMQDYVFWLGFPVLAAEIAARCKQRLALVLAISLACSPMLAGTALDQVVSKIAKLPAQPATPRDVCIQASAYDRLAALPPGLVAADIDLGPFILLNTKDPVVAAPYHRAAQGILWIHQIMTVPQAQAERRLLDLNVRYLLDCRAHPISGNTLMSGLRAGHVPDWLQPLSVPDQILQIYRVAP